MQIFAHPKSDSAHPLLSKQGYNQSDHSISHRHHPNKVHFIASPIYPAKPPLPTNIQPPTHYQYFVISIKHIKESINLTSKTYPIYSEIKPRSLQQQDIYLTTQTSRRSGQPIVTNRTPTLLPQIIVNQHFPILLTF